MQKDSLPDACRVAERFGFLRPDWRFHAARGTVSVTICAVAFMMGFPGLADLPYRAGVFAKAAAEDLAARLTDRLECDSASRAHRCTGGAPGDLEALGALTSCQFCADSHPGAAPKPILRAGPELLQTEKRAVLKVWYSQGLGRPFLA